MRLLSALAVVALLGGCMSPQYVATVAPICGEKGSPPPIKHVWISKKDFLTEETARDLEWNNLAREKLCGRSRPPATPKNTGATS